MSVKAYWYINFFKQIYAASPAYGGWKASGGDSFKIMLVGPAYVPNQDTQAVKNDVIGEVVGQGYNAGGQVLTAKTISAASGVLVLTAADVTWSNCIFQSTRAVIYDDTNASPLSKQLVRWVEFGQTLDLNNQSLTLKFNGLGDIDVVTTPPSDSNPPQLLSATVNTSTLVLTFNEALDITSTPAASSFVVRVNGTAQASSSAVVVGSTTVTLTTAAPVSGGQTVVIDYTKPVVNPIQDSSGNDAASFFNVAVQNTTVTPLVDNAAFASQSVPQPMTTNTPYSVSVVMNNNGTTSWSAASGYMLRSTNPDANNIWGVVTVPVPQIILPEANCTFNFSVQAPSLAGTYNFQWRMYNGTANFGTASTNLSITVSAPVPPLTPTLIVQSPNGGENWVTGTLQMVRWATSNVTNPSTVRAEVSRDGGSIYTTIFSGVNNDGAHGWTPTVPLTITAKIRVTSESTPAATDISDTVFTISDPPTPPPPEPTAPTLTSFIAVNYQTVTWVNTNVTNETGYEYETAPALSGPWTVRGSRGVDNTTFTWETAAASTTYFGRVSSIGPSLTRYPSNVIQASTPPPPPPEPVAPSLISVSAPNSTSVTWTHNNVANEVSYDYETSPFGAGTWTLRGTAPANSTTFTWTGAAQSTHYDMRVSSVGASGTRYPSNVMDVTTPATPPPPPPPEPPAPVLGSVSAPSTTSIVWNHNNVADELGYEYQTSPPSAGTWTLRGTNPANSTTFTWSAASPSTTYDMRVNSFGAAGTRYPSNVLTVTTPTPPPPEPTAPTLSTLTVPVSTSLVWTHTNVANETGYEYSTAPASGGPYTVRGTSAANSTTFTWTTATPNTLYFARVASIGSSGTRYQSNVLSATTPPTPAATLTVVAPNGGENWLVGSVQTLRWSSANLGSDTIKVELTRDAGSSYETLFPSLTNDGSENWTVTQPTGTQNRLRVSGVANPTVLDSSDTNFTISVVSSGATYFVSTTGSDTTGTGTQANPWRTVRKGLTSGMVAGDTLYIRGGTYLEDINSGVYTVPVGSSFSNAPLISRFQSEPVTVRSVTLFHSYIRYMVFSGIVFNSPGMDQPFYLSNGANHIRAQDCEMTGGTFCGVVFSKGSTGGTDFNEMLRCNIHHNGDTARVDHGIYILTNSNLVQGCSIHHNAAFGVHIYGDGTPCNNNTVRDNRVYDNGVIAGTSWGILLSSGIGHIAYNNLVYGNSGGITADVGCVGGQIYFNTVFSNTRNGDPGIYLGSGSSGAIARDNICYQNSSDTIGGPGGVTKSNNLEGSNPMFVNTANADFHLLAGSPAINAGIAIAGITTDFAGTVRGNPPEIGAYEF